MPPLPVIDAQRLREDAARVVEACRDPGVFYLANLPFPADLCGRVLDAARVFFALLAEEKNAIHIRHSAHFRGYSEMHNARDWREQVHLASELPATAGERDYERLQGPNLWPAQLGDAWRVLLLQYLEVVGALGQGLLATIAHGFGLPDAAFVATSREPAYLLMKLIHYHAQPGSGPPRVGVAPHCDWSWVTLLLQCDVGGLQVRTPAGEWRDVPPVPNTLVVNVGELVGVVTGGRLRATPHRVVNHSAKRPRVSVPIFVNPPLSFVVAPTREPLPPSVEVEHVHRVLDPVAPRGPFVFGESEWQRKGLGRWCHRRACHESS